jgi:hypothetical protein
MEDGKKIFCRNSFYFSLRLSGIDTGMVFSGVVPTSTTSLLQDDYDRAEG